MNPFRSQPPAGAVPLFEIRLDSAIRDVVVLRGGPLDCPGVILRGTVVLSLHDPIQAKAITMTLKGKSRTSWTETFVTSSRVQSTRLQRDEKNIFSKDWSFLPGTMHNRTMGIGNYEYPFSVELPGDAAESVEGLEHGSVTWGFQATLERPGFASNIVCRRSCRVVRTLSVDSLEMAQTLSVDNTWPEKLEYSISVPTKSYPIGASIPINFKFVPLIKNLGIAKIVITLKEYQSYHIKHGYHGAPATHERDRTICSMTLDDIEKDVASWDIDQSLAIPSSLTQCVQDCEVGHFKVRHKLKFTVSLANPDGHISELRAALPVGLLIPPRLFEHNPSFGSLDPLDPENQLPSYGSHVYDRLYDGIETPLPSGMNTPAQSRSRRNSLDGSTPHDSEASRRALVAGLHQLTAMSSSLRTPGMPIDTNSRTTGSATPVSGSSTPHRSQPNSFTPAFNMQELTDSLEGSSRQSLSADSPQVRPEDQELPAPFTAEQMEGLNRIPSYGTATTRAAAAPLSIDLPDYDHSQPASGRASGASTPAGHYSHQAPTLARPEAARTASHRTGVFRAAHDRLTRARERDH